MSSIPTVLISYVCLFCYLAKILLATDNLFRFHFSQRGNPLGGLFYSTAWSGSNDTYQQVIEWHKYVLHVAVVFNVSLSNHLASWVATSSA